MKLSFEWFVNWIKKAKNVETGQLVEKLRNTVATKDALVESLKAAINKNEKQAEQVSTLVAVVSSVILQNYDDIYMVIMYSRKRYNDVIILMQLIWSIESVRR